MESTDEIQNEPTSPTGRECYFLPDFSVGDPDGHDPLETYSWQDLRDVIYGERVAQ